MWTVMSVVAKQRTILAWISDREETHDVLPWFSLIVAASCGFSKACAMLLDNGANIFSVDQKGKNFLLFKARSIEIEE